jgi:hypothetical protein
MESSAKTRLPLRSTGIFYPSPTLHHSHIGIIFTHISFTNEGEINEGSQMSPLLAINAKGGEILSPKQKDRTTNFKNFQNDDLCLSFQLVSYDKKFLQLIRYF